MTSVTTIYIPTRPQPDTIVAIFLLKTLGGKKFTGIENATVEIRHALAPGETFDTLLTNGVLALDIGGGALDHHGSDFCTAELVARYLQIHTDPSLIQLLAYANRDDKEGKGIISRDPLDRAFGLSGLIASLNKTYPQDPNKIVDTVLPLLAAHYASAKEHHVELPREVAEKKRRGEYIEATISQGNKTLKVVCIASDKPSMPTYLRSQSGPRADVVLQKSENTNHYCILTNQKRGVDLSQVMGLIRLREAELKGIEISSDAAYLVQTGRIEEIPFWYFDPATVSLLNGGQHNKTVEESRIAWEEMQKILQAGLSITSQ